MASNGTRGWRRVAAGPLIAVLGGLFGMAACARQTYQLPADAPPVVVADRPDGAAPPVQPPKKKGIIVPGDPASGTTRLGPANGEIETHTGTTGTRVLPDGR